MTIWTILLRCLLLVALTVWVGGFTFYSAVVIPVLHESLGSLDTGFVTQRVTDHLNAAGGVTWALWWLAAWVDRSAKPDLARHLRLWFLVATTIILLALIGLHDLMDRRLGSGSLRGFYPLHRTYLIASTARWLANLGLMLLVLVFWRNSSSVGDMGAMGRVTDEPVQPGQRDTTNR